MSKPSRDAIDLLGDILWPAGFGYPRMVQVIAGSLGRPEIVASMPPPGSVGPRDAVVGMLDWLATNGYFTDALVDAMEAEVPGPDPRAFDRVRVFAGLIPAQNRLVSEPELDAMIQAAVRGQLHVGLPHTRLKRALPVALRRRANEALDPRAQLSLWFQAANTQEVEIGDEVMLVSVLELAANHAVAEQETLKQWADNVRQSRLGAARSNPRADDPALLSGLQATVDAAGITVDAVQFVGELAAALQRVCVVRVGGKDRGTAFLVGPDLMLTNHHVLRDVIDGESTANSVSFVFDYRHDGGGATGPVYPLAGAGDAARPWLIDHLPPTDDEAMDGGTPDISSSTPVDRLDFALVRLDGRPGDERGVFDFRADAPVVFTKDTAIVVLGHPRPSGADLASPLTFSVEPRSVIRANPNGTRVQYRTNTMRGSSGSPVLTMALRLVALHHYGRPYAYNQGIPIAVIGQRPLVRNALGLGGP
jgi:hypothetical protein